MSKTHGGRLVVVHEEKIAGLVSLLGDEAFTFTPLETLPGFVRINAKGSPVDTITQLLQQGELRVVVGTRALLGEGWDAPVINSLILASFVGSYMLTNQMRGRAIRIDKGNPNKVASIWHIVAMATKTPAGLVDLYELERRFGTFVGLSEKEAVIENGLKRMQLPYIDRNDRVRSKSPVLLCVHMVEMVPPAEAEIIFKKTVFRNLPREGV